MSLKADLMAWNDGNLKDIDLDVLLEEMLDNIGAVDSELRDTLIYNAFGKLILDDYLTIKQMEYILEVCLKKMYMDIRQKESDSVFTRSFSSLVVALILEKDRQTRFLAESVVQRIIEESCEYIKLEEDIRGYVEGKGWAHSVAHGSDLLTEAVKHPLFRIDYVPDYLKAIKMCLLKDRLRNHPYIDDEDERLIFVIEALMEKGVTQEEMSSWLLEISDSLKEVFKKEGFSLPFFRLMTNFSQFCRTFYFRLLFKDCCKSLRDNVAHVLEQWHNQLYQSDGA
ncbi:DUF2785 domain-containing protein [Pullulanibacillus sp. KACC 23026]|uniref:DUF2785 domain-containing protein n=1 Tax=Pullulanibacillus sp. KACC 23026 TaxID=3028315 RepID=UPI0023AFB2B9|nr:DUF2785 domain-containing protein [Pullulanibacillus sp. KACC 23026]WEG14538.1 DUF2785 domain-containing protein [Pullulanibacillus sp. KACC 23026]